MAWILVEIQPVVAADDPVVRVASPVGAVDRAEAGTLAAAARA